MNDSHTEVLRQLCTDALAGKPRIPKLMIRVSMQASYLHCAKAQILERYRSSLQTHRFLLSIQ